MLFQLLCYDAIMLLFCAYVFIFVQTFQWKSPDFFFNLRASNRKSQSQQKLTKNITHFTIYFRSKNLSHFMNLNLLDVENNMPPQCIQKPFWLYKFSSKKVSVRFQKKYLHCIISWRPRTAFLKHLESKRLYISIYLLKKFFVSET